MRDFRVDRVEKNQIGRNPNTYLVFWNRILKIFHFETLKNFIFFFQGFRFIEGQMIQDYLE